MKKYAAILLAVLLLLNIGVLGVLADEPTGDPSGSSATTSTETDPSESTSSTSEEETDPTESSDPDTDPTGSTDESESTTSTSTTVAGGFTASGSISITSSNVAEITYESSDGSAPQSLIVAGKTIRLDSVGDGKAVVALSKLPYGVHPASLAFAKGTISVGSYERGGVVDTLMQIEVADGSVYAYVYDKEFSLPVANAVVTITVADRAYTPQQTNSSGRATFSGVLPSDKSVMVKCVFATQTIGNVTYNGQTGTKQVTVGATSNTSTTTSTTLPTNTEQSTVATYPTIYDTLTTSAAADGVMTDIIIDTNLLSQFGMENISAFTGKAKAVIPQAQYDSLSAAHGGAIFIKLITADVTVSADVIAEAIAENNELKKQDAANAVTLPFVFALQAIGNGVDEAITSDFSGTTYTVTVPVPTEMAGAKTMAIAMAGSNGLYNLHTATVTGDTVTFTVSDPDNYVLIGFKAASAAGDGNGSANWLVILLYVAGILLILGAVVVLLWPILRDKFFPKAETAEEADEDDVLLYDETAEEPAVEETAVTGEPELEAPAIIPPPIEDFPVIPVERKEPVADVSLGDFGDDVPAEKGGIDVDL